MKKKKVPPQNITADTQLPFTNSSQTKYVVFLSNETDNWTQSNWPTKVQIQYFSVERFVFQVSHA